MVFGKIQIRYNGIWEILVQDFIVQDVFITPFRAVPLKIVPLRVLTSYLSILAKLLCSGWIENNVSNRSQILT